MSGDRQPFDAVVLAGGRARRMSGADKAALAVGGASLLDRALAAVGHAERTVVVGPRRPMPAGVVAVQEEPPGGGPVAALGAALPHLGAGVVVVLAADLPFVSADDVDHIREHLGSAPADVDAAVAVDGAGRRQWLLGVWRTPALRRAVDAVGPVEGASMHRLTSALQVSGVSLPGSAHAPPAWFDVDTPEDLRRARRSAGGDARPER